MLPDAVLPDDAAFFVRFRHSLRLAEGELAARLNTSVETIVALETGATLVLPAWPEVVRIVNTCAGAARVDPAPLLDCLSRRLARDRWAQAESRLRQELSAAALSYEAEARPALAPEAASGWAAVAGGEPHAPAAPLLAYPQTLAPAPLPAANAGVFGRLGGGLRAAHAGDGRRSGVIWVGAAGLALVLVVLAQTRVPDWIARRLPAPAGAYARSAADSFALLFAPQRDGLRWIEVDDPRVRRADKLPASPR